MSEFNRFDFEQQIMKCWNITDDLYAVYETVCDGSKIDQDKLANLLLGLQTLYEVKFNKLFDMFEQGIEERKIL